MYRADLHPHLRDTLAALRARRGFDAEAYIQAKTARLGAYLRHAGLGACVVGVSGGIDSAVTLALCARARAGRVVAALLPMFVPAGATGQDVALSRGREVAAACGAECVTIDLGAGHAAVLRGVEQGVGVASGPWAAGQLVSTLRTPALYHVATLLTQQGCPALVVGTTNRDEGAYLGFFGKASDGMVDLQLISDAHKSEVRAVAARLGVPAAVREATPTGDTFDGRPDEEMIGAPYDFVELHALLRCAADAARLQVAWGDAAWAQFHEWSARVEALHRHNAHKYIGGSPAVHLDVYPRAVPGGWREDAPPRPPPGDFVGLFQLSPGLVAGLRDPVAPVLAPLEECPSSAWLVRGLLSPAECARLRDEVAAAGRVPVGQDGMRRGFDPATQPVGSYRATIYDDDLARRLWERLAPLLPPLRVMDEDTPTDWQDHKLWRPVGINPLCRFIWYEPGGLLVPHYDAGHDFGDGERHTLVSVLIYLGAGHPDRGATRLIRDPQRDLPLRERVYADWPRPAREDEVLCRVPPQQGAALLLDHRVLHDAEAWPGPGERLVLRTDLVYQRCGPRLPARWVGKVLRDPYYAGAYPLLGSAEGLHTAGFFDDGSADVEEDRRGDPSWLVTPVHKLLRRLDALPPGDGELAVLLSTGGFCPVHEGHVEMMERARAALERRGVTVLGGYLSPSHDGYVQGKCGADTPPAPHRLRMCEEALRHSEWLMADGWEALHTARAINFTDVIDRLERYLLRHLRTPRPLRVVYVCGADNAGFALAFLSRGRCVVVPRAGHEARLAEVARHPLLAGNPRIVVAEAPAPDAASRRVRAGDETGLSPGVRRLWQSFREAGRGTPAAAPLRLYLRDEGAWALAPWREGRDPDALAAARQDFQGGLLAALRDAFAAPAPPDVPRALQIEVLSLDRQREHVIRVAAGERVLSLDPCIPGDADLGVSRRFTVACDQAQALVARPGWPPLEAQLRALRPGRYLLLDDDTASGETLEQVRRRLPEGVEISRVLALCALGPPQDGEVRELCDARDFLAGAREGGLVIGLPDGTLARAPYLLPYVRPAARLQLPLSMEIAFSRRVWWLNAAFYQRITPRLCVRDAAPAFQVLAAYAGFSAGTSLAEVCQWHAERLPDSWASNHCLHESPPA